MWRTRDLLQTEIVDNQQVNYREMKKPHYYYQISVTSVVADQLQVFVDQCADAAEQARKWAEKQGAPNSTNTPSG